MATSEDDLTSEQTDKLLQFQDLTGIEDFDQCRSILNSHSWNLESAAHDQFNEPHHHPLPLPSPTTPPTTPLTPRRERSPIVNVVNPSNQRIFLVPPPPHLDPHQSWIGWGYAVAMIPLRLIYTSFFGICSYIYHIFRNRSRMISGSDGMNTIVNQVNRSADIDMREFIEEFENIYGTNHPSFHPSSYNQALIEAKRDLRFMLVYLHSPSHQDVPHFVRNTLCSVELQELITNNNILFWACSVNLAEGYKVSQYIRERTYPFLALILLKQHKMTVVARIEGNHAKEALIVELNNLISVQRPSLLKVQLERDERNQTVTLRQQQDEAYEQSLIVDREKERKRREKEEEKLKERRERDEEERRDAELEEMKSEVIERLKVKLRSLLPSEPDPTHPTTIRVLFKLPSGKRLERSFRKMESLQLLYDFLLVHESSPDNFQIFTPHPKQLIPCVDRLAILKKCGYGRGGGGGRGGGRGGGIAAGGNSEDNGGGVGSDGSGSGGGGVGSDGSGGGGVGSDGSGSGGCGSVSDGSGGSGSGGGGSSDDLVASVPTFDQFGFQKAQMLHVHDVDC